VWLWRYQRRHRSAKKGIILKIYITDFAYINDKGFGNYTSHTNWTDIGMDNFSQCQWKHLFESACDRFGRLDLLSKHVVAAVELLGMPLPRNETKDDRTAVYIGTELGSYEIDKSFYKSITQPGGASPKLFTYTLPSIAIGEVSIRYNITGPNLCISAGQLTGLVALWQSVVLLKNREIAKCITIISDAGSPDTELPSKSYAYAVLLTAKLPENPHEVTYSLDFDDQEHNYPAVNDIHKLYEFIKKPQTEVIWFDTPNGYNTKNRLRIERRA
jgi:3-oxoacyl-(acyl-carrier-protein) synthase